MENVLVFGASGHAKVVADILETEGKYHIVGFIDSFRERNDICFGAYKVLGKESDLVEVSEQYNIQNGIIAIGDNWIRKIVRDRILNMLPGFRFVNAIHPTAVVAKTVDIGCGVVVMPNAVVNAYSNLGDFSIVNTASSIDHDNVLGQFSSVAPRVVTGGNVTVGDFTAIGIGAIVKHKVLIGAHSVIGAGSLVLKDISDYGVYYGTPVKKVRARMEGERYL